MQVRANSVWFQDETNLTHWQQLKKSGDTSALTSFQEQVLSQRDAWQFVNPRHRKGPSLRTCKKAGQS